MYNKIMRYRMIFAYTSLFIFVTTLLAKSVYANMCFPTFMAKNLTIARADEVILECGPYSIGTHYHFRNRITLKGDMPEHFTIISDDNSRCSHSVLENLSAQKVTLQLPPREETVNLKQGRTYVLALYGTNNATEYLLYGCKGILAEGDNLYDPRMLIGIGEIVFFPLLFSGFILGLNLAIYLDYTFPVNLYLMFSVALMYYSAIIYLSYKVIKFYCKYKQCTAK